MSDDLVNTADILFNAIIKAYNNRKIEPGNAIIITAMIMEKVEKIKGLSGPEKKQLVIDVMWLLVEKSGLIVEEDKEAMKIIVKNLVPNAIDALVSASHGQLKIQVKSFCCN
jgi:C4-dicarboxylate-specific signal transduction histidine kinase